MSASPVKHFMVTYFMHERCYEEMFVNFRLHVPCLVYLLKKTAGLWILLDNLFALIPQLLKILWRGSAEGLSLTAALLQLYAFSCPVVYAAANNFPLFAWAERLFTLAQTVALIFLILYHRGNTLRGLLLILVYSGLMFLLGSYVSLAVASAMYSSSSTALIASKAFQARSNYGDKHTGQLSTVSVFLSWAGSLGHLFLSLQDGGSSFEILSHVLSVCLSCVLLVQILCYRRNTITKKKSE